MKKLAGFTLIELMIVIAILTILIASSSPNIFRWLTNQRFNSAVRDVQATLADMRLYAVKENAQATVTIVNNANNYQTDKWKRGIDEHQIDVHDLPTGVTISSDFPGGNLIFTARGMATPGTITIRGPSGQEMQIIVSMTGSIRIG